MWLALAHPVRLRILHELTSRDAARATDLAVALNEPVNSVSFHLRQLARFSYVEPDESPRSDGRERWWRAADRRGFKLDGDELTKTPGGEKAARATLEFMREQAHGDVDAWYDATLVPEEQWARAPRQSHYVQRLHLSDAELDAFQSELGALLDKWSDHARTHPESEAESDRAGAGAGREAYDVFGFGMHAHGLDQGRRSREYPSGD